MSRFLGNILSLQMSGEPTIFLMAKIWPAIQLLSGFTFSKIKKPKTYPVFPEIFWASR